MTTQPKNETTDDDIVDEVYFNSSPEKIRDLERRIVELEDLMAVVLGKFTDYPRDDYPGFYQRLNERNY